MRKQVRRRRKTINPEDIVVMKVANFLKENAPDQPFRFDLVDKIGLQNGKLLKEIHGSRWNRGYPDLFLPHCTKKYGGMYLELKATKTVHDTEHNREQARYHEQLRKRGYKVSFCCGVEECIKKIKKYLKL